MSRPCIFSVLNLNEVYLLHVGIELLNSVYIMFSAGLSWVWYLVQMRSVGDLSLLVGKGKWHQGD